MNVIKMEKLTKSYGKSRGIIDVDLTLQNGEFFGFIGPNGAGKSTTIRTILGLINKTSGNATIFDKEIGVNQKDFLQDIGYLPSEVSFYDGMKVSEIIKLSASLHHIDCEKEAASLCERLQLDTSRKIEELSFGNKKKVGIICALQHKPKLLILDEPTSGLDPLMQKEFFAILHERNVEGTTIFLSSHILSEIEHHCTRAAIIREGRIIACDLVKNLMKTSAKRITIHGHLNKEQFINEVGYQYTHDSVSFLFNGDYNELIKQLAMINITDLTISEPDLEEVFMHYYTDGGKE